MIKKVKRFQKEQGCTTDLFRNISIRHLNETMFMYMKRSAVLAAIRRKKRINPLRIYTLVVQSIVHEVLCVRDAWQCRINGCETLTKRGHERGDGPWSQSAA
jgi:hypothetical protein